MPEALPDLPTIVRGLKELAAGDVAHLAGTCVEVLVCMGHISASEAQTISMLLMSKVPGAREAFNKGSDEVEAELGEGGRTCES